MNKLLSLLALSLLTVGACGGGTSYVRSDAPLGRVVIYRSGIAYFERMARVEGDTLRLSVPADKVDDFLKSLTVVDAKTGKPAPISYPTTLPSSRTGLIDMEIRLPDANSRELKLSYISEAPSWKPSYRVVVGDDGRLEVQAWAIVDNASGEDWQQVHIGVGSSSALSFRYDLRSVRLVQRETLQPNDLFAQAPPTGGTTYGGDGTPVNVVGELTDETIAANDDASGAFNTVAQVSTATLASTRGGGMSKSAGPRMRDVLANDSKMPAGGGYAQSEAPRQSAAERSQLDRLVATARNSKNEIVIEGYADPSDSDKVAASLTRANRVREQLIRRGVDPNQVVAVGKGEADGRSGGVRVVEAPPAKSPVSDFKETAATDADPIGASHFESTTPMTVPRGTSAMVSILDTQADGEIVYLYDPESSRGNSMYPFRSVRIVNPTDSTLESGPVTVFGAGKFIGEGLCEPIPARTTAFVPFALDRQVVVNREDDTRDAISRLITVQRGVLSSEVKHTRTTKLTLNNRMAKAATVYVRHTVPKGYSLTESPERFERTGAAHLFRVDLEPHGKTEVVIEEATPVFRTVDIRSPEGLELVRVYLSTAREEGPLKTAMDHLLALHREMTEVEQRIQTAREQMEEYKVRMDELHSQVFTLKAVKTGGSLMKNLERKLSEMSDKLSQATIDLVALQERQMLSRIRFQDGVAELTLETVADSGGAE